MVVNADFRTQNPLTSQTRSLTPNSTNIFSDRQQTEKLEKYFLAVSDRYFDLDTLKNQISKSVS